VATETTGTRRLTASKLSESFDRLRTNGSKIESLRRFIDADGFSEN
jgi:hypothetical protein